MIPLGFFQVLVIPVYLILIQLGVGESLAIPLISEPMRIHGALTEKHSGSFVQSSGRERRDTQCTVGQYLHPNGSHCCTKCHKGTYLSEHCSGPDRATTCPECPVGAYMSKDNYADKCFACQKCRTTFQQIIKKNCTKLQNTVCGCDINQYKTTRNAEFFCKNCSDCHNGKIRQDCTPDSDTICECHRNFFLETDQNRCLPCSSCDNNDCKKQCEPEMVIKNPSNSTELIPVLICLTIAFAVGFIVLAFKAIKKYFPEKQYFSFCTSGQQTNKQHVSMTEDKTENTPLDTKEEKISGTMQMLPLSQAQGQELPDCIKSARETRISDSPMVFFVLMDAIPVKRWKEFMLFLGLSDNTLDRIYLDYRHVREAQYETLKEWRLLANQDASMERISQVLSQMDLSGCFEIIQEKLAKN
ncbi:tumor necrosis factor receptor superfamily member 1A-like [Erythrolamprus reginae]|uniref:tumor necrosis factor receptor superfamily member 1A-like n=1 Tax=Erythrolamprus reginae TaxID=121349 RepID=UPI00396C418E